MPTRMAATTRGSSTGTSGEMAPRGSASRAPARPGPGLLGGLFEARSGSTAVSAMDCY